jgi:hypothetical protein
MALVKFSAKPRQTESERLALQQQKFAFNQQKKAANYMEEAYKATLPPKPAPEPMGARGGYSVDRATTTSGASGSSGTSMYQGSYPVYKGMTQEAVDMVPQIIAAHEQKTGKKIPVARAAEIARQRTAPQQQAPTGQQQAGGGVPNLTGGGYSILPYNQGAAGGGGTVNYPSLGGGAYPAPGTMYQGGSAYFSGTVADPARAIQETKDIYNQVVPYQKQAVGQYAGELYGAEGQMQDVAAGYAQREQDLSGLLEGYGEHELGRIEQRREQLRAQAKQDLLSRGLTSTSAYDASMRGIEQTAGDQIRGYQDALTRQKMDYMSMLTGDTLQARAGAAGFAADQAGSRFGASQVPTQSMERLASLLAQQRSDAARILTSGQDIGLGYAQLAESARQAAQGRLLSQAQGTMQAGLGYADLASQLRIANASI